jgi:hypothetical protein
MVLEGDRASIDGAVVGLVAVDPRPTSGAAEVQAARWRPADGGPRCQRPASALPGTRSPAAAYHERAQRDQRGLVGGELPDQSGRPARASVPRFRPV